MNYMVKDNITGKEYTGTYGEMLGLSIYLERFHYWHCELIPNWCEFEPSTTTDES